MNLQNIPHIKHLDSNNFFILAGPCAIDLLKKQTVLELILLQELVTKRRYKFFKKFQKNLTYLP